LACAFLLGGCAAPSALIAKAAGVDRDEVPSARGVWDNDLLGVHLMVDFSHLRDGDEAPRPPYVHVFAVREQDWSAQFDAPEASAHDARAWFAAHGEALQREFAIMVARVHERYPGERGRRFRVIALPPHSRFDGAWPVLSTDGRDLAMTFAMPLPASATDGESMTNVNALLLHEFSHTYFKFHPEHYVNNFSDEVVAYIEQGCLLGELHPQATHDDDTPLHALAERISDLPPHEIYARYRDRYADTMLGYFSALHELARFKDGFDDPAAQELCRTLPTAGRDFTKPPLS
jgi:hypothetical protein